MDPTASVLSSGVWAWLEQRGGFAGALLVASLWLLMLLRERGALIARSETLSALLCRTIENGSAERLTLTNEHALRNDWTVRSLLETFTALAEKRELRVPDMPPLKPHTPPEARQNSRESDDRPTPVPPPLPPPPLPPKRTNAPRR